MKSSNAVLKKSITFRDKVPEIPSTTYGTFSLYRYPAKFIPQVIAYTLNKYAKKGMTVFDPFAGYGTTGVVSGVYGHDYELWDLNPLLGILHKIATMSLPEYDIKDLLSNMRLSDKEFIPDWSNYGYWFPEEFFPFLFRMWGFYHSLSDDGIKLLLTIPLLKATRTFSYDDIQRQKLSKSPRSKKRINSLLKSNWEETFYKKIEGGLHAVIKGISEHHRLSRGPVKSTVKAGVDTLESVLIEEMDMLITSPPYLQAQEYIRHAKMDLFWLGYPESFTRELSKKEIPYRDVEPFNVKSDVYHTLRKEIGEERPLEIFDSYFQGVLGALTRLQKRISSYLFLFVGPATLWGRPIPIDDIFRQHFMALGWNHECTLIDTIIKRRMSFYKSNPATGVKDRRIRTESLVVLKR